MLESGETWSLFHDSFSILCASCEQSRLTIVQIRGVEHFSALPLPYNSQQRLDDDCFHRIRAPS